MRSAECQYLVLAFVGKRHRSVVLLADSDELPNPSVHRPALKHPWDIAATVALGGLLGRMFGNDDSREASLNVRGRRIDAY